MNNNLVQRWKKATFDIVDGSALGVFRIFWGLIMLLETRWMWRHLDDLHSDRYFHFYYKGFSWIRHFPERWMTELEIIAMMISAILIVVGVAFRPAALVFFIGYTHLFYAEAGAYNNHFYLIMLLSGVLFFTRADAYHSLHQWRRGKKGLADEGVPRWNYLLIQIQVVIVYVYGAIAKINTDWMIAREPITFWLKFGQKVPDYLKGLIQHEWFTYIAAYGGFFIDLLCPFMLFHRKLRIPAIVILVSFHFLNSQIFSIGFFPIIGVALLIVILPPNLFRRNRDQHPAVRSEGNVSRPILLAVSTFCIFQILFPLRWHLARPANPSWTDVGHRFSWRMMLRSRISRLDLRFSDPDVELWLKQNPGRYPRLSPSNGIRWAEYPNFIWQYVQALHAALEEHGMGETKIYAHVTTSLNGRDYYPSIDPHVDLARVENPYFAVPDWVLPLPEDMEPDYEQIMPLENSRIFSWEALKEYLDENPGPGSDYLIEKPTNEKPKLPDIDSFPEL